MEQYIYVSVYYCSNKIKHVKLQIMVHNYKVIVSVTLYFQYGCCQVRDVCLHLPHHQFHHQLQDEGGYYHLGILDNRDDIMHCMGYTCQTHSQHSCSWCLECTETG